jgi:anti-anti-sigma factor
MLKINESSDGQWATGRILHEQSVHTVRLTGTLDEHTVSQLRELSEVVFNEKGFSEGDHFLIDLSEVTEVDHVGLAALVGIMAGLAAKAGSLGLILPEGHPVRHALKVTGLDRVFELHETGDAARVIIRAVYR